MVSIPACHAGDQGSIPCRGDIFYRCVIKQPSFLSSRSPRLPSQHISFPFVVTDYDTAPFDQTLRRNVSHAFRSQCHAKMEKQRVVSPETGLAQRKKCYQQQKWFKKNATGSINFDKYKATCSFCHLLVLCLNDLRWSGVRASNP